MSAIARIAEFVVKTRLDDCPRDAIASVRRAALDSIGVMLAGSTEPIARIVREVARAEGGTPLCTVVGASLRTSPTWAALANGAAGHAHDFDDTSFALLGHPSVPLLAAALAAAEAETADGAAVTLAYLLGFEIDAAIGSAINPDHYTRGWHSTATIGTIGCAAAVARLLALDLGQVRHALGLAVSLASGLKENFGSMTKPYHAGHAARNGARRTRPALARARDRRGGQAVSVVCVDPLRHRRAPRPQDTSWLRRRSGRRDRGGSEPRRAERAHPPRADARARAEVLDAVLCGRRRCRRPRRPRLVRAPDPRARGFADGARDDGRRSRAARSHGAARVEPCDRAA